MKKTLLSLFIVPLITTGGFTFAQEGDWIEHDADAGTVTVYSADGSYGIVIQDKNLGATEVGGGTGASSASYGCYYQWGNNYCFPSDPSAEITISSTKVDASAYGPDNPYSSGTFIKRPPSYNNWTSDWSSVRNDNLRGGTGDNETNGWGLESDNPITGRQGPCPEGYHVPSVGEIDEFVVTWYNHKYNADLPIGSLIYSDTLQEEGINVAADFSNDIFMPFASIYWGDEGEIEPYYYNIAGQFWSSTPYSRMGFTLSFTLRNGKSGLIKNAAYLADDNYRSTAMSVRCFKNEHVYRETSKTLTLNVMSGENLVSTGVSFTTDEPLTSGQVLEAIDRLSNEIELTTGYHFEWYADDEGVETGFDLDTAISEGSITSNLALTGKIEPNKYTISFLDENGAEIMSGEFTYDQETILPANTSTKEGYTFKGWKDGQGNTYEDGASVKNLTTDNGAVLEFSPIREENSKPSGGGSSGGGGHRRPKSNVKSEEQENEKNDESNTGYEVKHGSAEIKDGYAKEMNDAYIFSYENGITTMNSIEKADMTGGLTRIAMAKMLSYYAINILGMEPDKTMVNDFKDVTDELSVQYDNGVKLAYQLGIMGINMPNNEFRPFDLVSRAEFGTAFSRMLYGLADGDKFYYSTHLKKLKEEKIIKNNNPNLRELRGYVMLMLMRSTMIGNGGDDFVDEDMILWM